MNNKVASALKKLLESYSIYVEYSPKEVEQELATVFDLTHDFREKLNRMDVVVDKYPQIELLRDVIFDLLLINFFAEDTKRLAEDYLESEEWDRIEEDTIDRGTELLNIMLYINECAEEDIEPDIYDFLNEFLLVEDEDFQEECAIYEHVIANQELTEVSFKEIAERTNSISDEHLQDLLCPIILFFQNHKPKTIDADTYIKQDIISPYQWAVYQTLLTYQYAK